MTLALLSLLLLCVLSKWTQKDRSYGKKMSRDFRADPPPGMPILCYTATQAPLLHWPPGKKFEAASISSHPLAKQGPFIIRGLESVNGWDALRKWVPKYISKHVSHLRYARKSESPWVGPLWEKEKPLAPLLTWEYPYTEANLTSTAFFHASRRAATMGVKEKQMVSWVGMVEELSPLIEDILPIDDLLFNLSQTHVNVWIAGPPITTHIHYDSYINLNVQIRGTKQFVLVPPSSSHMVGSYPWVHPSNAQGRNALLPASHERCVQTNHNNEDDGNKDDGQCEEDEGVKAQQVVNAIEATLERGDVLFIPPMWWHQVHALSLSVSLNSWGWSEQSIAQQQAVDTTLTLFSLSPSTSPTAATTIPEAQWPLAALLLLSQLLPLLDARRPADTPNLLHQTRARFTPLLSPVGTLPSSFLAGCPSTSKEPNMDSDDDDVAHTAVQAIVPAIAGAFAKLPSDVLGLWVPNYVELVVYCALMDSTYIGAFLKDCLPDPVRAK